jgi:hypothetical protein
MPDWMRKALSQVCTSAATFKTNAQTPVAWINNNSDDIDAARLQQQARRTVPVACGARAAVAKAAAVCGLGRSAHTAMKRTLPVLFGRLRGR